VAEVSAIWLLQRQTSAVHGAEGVSIVCCTLTSSLQWP